MESGLDLVIVAGPQTIAETYTVRVSRRDIAKLDILERRQRSKSLDRRHRDSYERKSGKWSPLKPVNGMLFNILNTKYSKM